ncbi:MAG: esterase [Chitinophagaceae bacterium]|nr:esterase [Chitinophagaceae bacterium]
MQIEKRSIIVQESIELESAALGRNVSVDVYLPHSATFLAEDISLLLINDGQDLEKMGLTGILEELYSRHLLSPVVCAGIHAGPERKMEYGTAGTPDFLGRGALAADYAQFVLQQVIPAVQDHCKFSRFNEKAFLGWSLGALSAMDIVWRHPQEFSRAGLFSGSFWWRTKDKTDPEYNDRTDRIMQRQVAEGSYHPGLKFFFECGTEDETEDRNHNGIIDSIDDTYDLIRELVSKGYDPEKDIRYVEIAGGRHETATWAKVLPEFLLWAYNKKPR